MITLAINANVILAGAAVLVIHATGILVTALMMITNGVLQLIGPSIF
jgi:hypothetical protein